VSAAELAVRNGVLLGEDGTERVPEDESGLLE
jgi:hypothetical protein